MSSNSRSPQMATTMNGGKRPPTSRHDTRNSLFSANSQHSDLIKYICDSWNSVSQEYRDSPKNQRNQSLATVIYYEGEPSPRLKDFEPFDLERLWVQKNEQDNVKNTDDTSS